MPKLNDHGLGGGGGKALGVPIYPFKTVNGVIKRDTGAFQTIYGENIATIPAQSYSNAGCAVGDEIYLIGMMDDENACYKYNVNTKVWTVLTSSPYSGQKVWAVPSSSNRYIYYGIHDETGVYVYDTLLDTHAYYTGAGHFGAYSSATIDGDYIYIFGGNYSSAYRTYATRVDLGYQTYTRLSNIPDGMFNHCVVNGGDGYIYLFGGQVSSTIAYKYSIADDTYTAITSLPFNSYGTMGVRIDNYIYLMNSAHSLYPQAMYVYDILTDTYTSIGTTPKARQYGIVGVYDNVIYMLGGGTSSTTYTSGESLMVVRGTKMKLTTQRLCKGVKVHTNGVVTLGTLKEFDGSIIVTSETRVDVVNGVATIPSDGVYILRNGTYGTIGG